MPASRQGVDALWAGLPIITAPEATLASRLPASLALGGGSGATVARNLEDYEEVMSRIAAGGKGLDAARRSVEGARGEGCGGEGAGAPVWDIVKFTRAFERGLALSWEAVVQGRGRGRNGRSPQVVVGSSATQ